MTDGQHRKGAEVLDAVLLACGAFMLAGVISASGLLIHGYFADWTYSPHRYRDLAGGFRGLLDMGLAFCIGGSMAARATWLRVSDRYKREGKEGLPGGEMDQADRVVGFVGLAALLLLIVVANFG